MPTLKKHLSLPIIISLCLFTRIDSSYAAGNCGIPNLDATIDPVDVGADDWYAYAYQNDSTGPMGGYSENTSTYGISTDNTWAVEFPYGTIWGKSRCSSTSGDNLADTWDGEWQSYYVKTPVDDQGKYCWCQATGFTASGNSYTSGPQCTTSESDSWVFYNDLANFESCAYTCAYYCYTNVEVDWGWAAENQGLRLALFRVAGYVPQIVSLNWYDGNSTINGPSSCTVGGTFLPPTPAARPGYVFTGWKAKPSCASLIRALDADTGGTAYGYARLNESNGSQESTYGLTQSSGQWAVQFSYGTVYGQAKCNATQGANKGDVNDNLSTNVGQYCWCQATGFTPTSDSYTSGPQCTINPVSSSWVVNRDNGTFNNCKNGCASFCALDIQNSSFFRSVVFNVAGQ